MRTFDELRIAVAGTGYVGLSLAVLLSQKHEVKAVDILPEKVEMVNAGKSPIQDREIEEYLAEKPLRLTATLDGRAAYADADFVIVAAPTNYDPHRDYFDTSAVEAVIRLALSVNPDAWIVIGTPSFEPGIVFWQLLNNTTANAAIIVMILFILRSFFS